MKVVVLLTLIFGQVAMASCINLAHFQLGGSASQSELDAFNAQKLEIYRSFVLSENSITNSYTQKVQRLYQQGLSDGQLKVELNRLDLEKTNQLSGNCKTYHTKLSNLVRTFH